MATIGRTKTRLSLPDADEGAGAAEDPMIQKQEESMTQQSDTIEVTPALDTTVAAWRL